MGESIRLGRIAGIAVGVNWSVLIIATLIALGLGVGGLPQLHPGHPEALYLVTGVLTAGLFLGSILAHELAHAIVARRRGVEVEGIVLWLLGGVAKFRSEARTPRDEIAIAAAGPAMSLIAAAVFGIASGASALLVGEAMSTTVLGWLGVLNLLLTAFNLIPAAPLDGGRILRGVLWARRGDPASAAASAARGGKGFGIALIALGLLLVVGMVALDGLWLMLLGWFIVTAAGAEEFHASLRGVRVRDVMTRAPVVAPDWLTLQEVVDQYVLTQRCSTFPLRGFDGRISGLLPLAAVKRVPSEQRATQRARDVACPIDRVATGHPDEELTELLQRVRGTCGEGRALVFDAAGELVGIVSPRDVGRARELHTLRQPQRNADDPPTSGGQRADEAEPTGTP